MIRTPTSLSLSLFIARVAPRERGCLPVPRRAAKTALSLLHFGISLLFIGNIIWNILKGNS